MNPVEETTPNANSREQRVVNNIDYLMMKYDNLIKLRSKIHDNYNITLNYNKKGELENLVELIGVITNNYKKDFEYYENYKMLLSSNERKVLNDLSVEIKNLRIKFNNIQKEYSGMSNWEANNLFFQDAGEACQLMTKFHSSFIKSVFKKYMSKP